MPIRFGSFQNAQQANVPNYANAAAMQGQLDNAAQARADALRNNNIQAGSEAYNSAMGEETPIADGIQGLFNTPASAQGMDLGLAAESGGGGLEAIQASQGLDPMAFGSTILPEAGAVTEVGALGEQGVAQVAEQIAAQGAAEGLAAEGASALAAESAATTAAGASGGGFLSALGASSPYIAGALALYNLLS